MPDRIEKIRGELDALGACQSDGDATAAALGRQLAVRAAGRWARYRAGVVQADNGEMVTMCAEFAAAHALAALAETDPELGAIVAKQITAAWTAGSGVGEWLWLLLGDELAQRVTALTMELVHEMARGAGA